MSKQLPVQQIFDEWWRIGDIVVGTDQQRKDIEQGFFIGFYAGLGMAAKANKISRDDALALIKGAMEECRAKFTKRGVKFTASIDGKPTNN